MSHHHAKAFNSIKYMEKRKVLFWRVSLLSASCHSRRLVRWSAEWYNSRWSHLIFYAATYSGLRAGNSQPSDPSVLRTSTMRLLPIQKLYLPQSNDQGQSPNFCMSLKHPETVCVILHRTTKGLRIIFLIISTPQSSQLVSTPKLIHMI